MAEILPVDVSVLKSLVVRKSFPATSLFDSEELNSTPAIM
jgi:hypothetical protein